MKILCGLFFPALLCGCSTAIKYSEWTAGSPVQSTALRFTLQDSAVTFTSSGQTVATTGKATSNCPAVVTNADWWTCFSQVAASAVIAPPNSNPAPTIYVATPDDGSHLYFSTTTISGTNVTGQDTLYTQVTIKYTNNASSVIAGAGSGAVTGFGIAGPYGGIAGLILGGGAAVAAARGLPQPNTIALANYVCGGETVDLTHTSITNVTPAVYFPLTVKGPSARPFAPTLNADSPQTAPSACWHALPNTQSLGSAVPVAIGNTLGSGPPRDPVAGDGWLYRFVAMSDVSKPPLGAQPMSAFLNSKDSSQQFPYTACRDVTIEITWWKELNDAISAAQTSGGDPKPRVLAFPASVADPNYVFVASVKKGGVITFKPDCGATVSITPDTSNVAAISAAVTNAENIYKAEQSWEASKKK
jgi:hypothetical protein